MPGCGLRPVNAVAPLRDVQIQLKNPLLVQREFQTPCHDGFLDLPQDRTLRRKPQVLGKLLRDGAAPGGHPAFIPVTLQRIVHLGKIESVVLPEQIVFGRHHGLAQRRSNALERNPLLPDTHGLAVLRPGAVLPLLLTVFHKRRGPRLFRLQPADGRPHQISSDIQHEEEGYPEEQTAYRTFSP